MAQRTRACDPMVSKEAPTFYPSEEEFSDFVSYVQKIEGEVSKVGICKIVPPASWSNKMDYSSVDFQIDQPIQQSASAGQQAGSYTVWNIQQPAKSYKKFCEQGRALEQKGTINELERLFWRSLLWEPPLYGADTEVSTLFFPTTEHWNLTKLNTILDRLTSVVPGVNTPFLYVGRWRSLFAWHAEDMNLNSINYLHVGAPKVWYAIPDKDSQRFERFARSLFPDLAKDCPEFLRHKQTVISPRLLHKQNIQVTRVVQNAGEFVVTMPYSYHAGFNTGVNCAEAINFATERWLEFGKQANVCRCRMSSVSIDMTIFESRDWLQCDTCGKWRVCSYTQYAKLRREEFTCDRLPDTTCDTPEDTAEEEEETVSRGCTQPAAPAACEGEVAGVGRERRGSSSSITCTKCGSSRFVESRVKTSLNRDSFQCQDIGKLCSRGDKKRYLLQCDKCLVWRQTTIETYQKFHLGRFECRFAASSCLSIANTSEMKPRGGRKRKLPLEPVWVQCDRCDKWRHLPADPAVPAIVHAPQFFCTDWPGLSCEDKQESSS